MSNPKKGANPKFQVTVNDDDKLDYEELRAIATQIYTIDSKMRHVRVAILIFILLVLGSVTFILVMYAVFMTAANSQVEKSDNGQLLLTATANAKQVLKSQESFVDVDGSDLIDYLQNETDASGQVDGEWLIPDSELGNIRSVAWKDGFEMHVHHIAEVQRIDGDDAHILITTRAKHQFKIWDSDRGAADNATADNFNVYMREWDLENEYGPRYKSWVEVLPEADEGDGRGRVLISMKRDKIKPGNHTVNLENYWCDFGDACVKA